jgi:hypothetical protein
MNTRTRRYEGRVFRCINIDGCLAWLPHQTDAQESVSPISGRTASWYERAKAFLSNLPECKEAASPKMIRKDLIKAVAADYARLQDKAARLQKELVQTQDALYVTKEELRRLMSDTNQ